jgi:hypothetical protein
MVLCIGLRLGLATSSNHFSNIYGFVDSLDVGVELHHHPNIFFGTIEVQKKLKSKTKNLEYSLDFKN